MKKNSDTHLDIYLKRSELHRNGQVTVFEEGKQSKEAQERHAKVIKALQNGYLEEVYQNCLEYDTSKLDDKLKGYLKELVDGVTSEVGRAIVGLTFLQLTIKSIVPEQSIRLHKGSTSNGKFSWKEGISMRSIDKNYNTPFLRGKGLLSLNADGVMMTRSLAENYPYSSLYKAEMRGAFDTWIKIVEESETRKVDFKAAFSYMMSLMINKSNRLEQVADETLDALRSIKRIDLKSVSEKLSKFFTETRYSARAFEVVIHGFMQAYVEMGFTDYELEPLSQMRSANKKHKNVGDIELKEGNIFVEAWDAKYGKSYLYEELGELEEKLEAHPGVHMAGFIANDRIEFKEEVKDKQTEVEFNTGTKIHLFTFNEWIEYELKQVPVRKRNDFAKKWLTAVVESFARKRLDMAPIDEPCEQWLLDLQKIL